MINCSIEHLIYIVFEGMSGAPIHISQHQYLDLIPKSVFRISAIPNECFLVLSTEISKENSDSEVGESQHVYLQVVNYSSLSMFSRG